MAKDSSSNNPAGNVIGLKLSATPPQKKYILWAKQIDLPANPEKAILHYFSFEEGKWVPLLDFEPIPANQYNLGFTQVTSSRQGLMLIMEYLSRQTTTTTLPTPAAPSILAQSDSANTITFTAPAGYLITDCGYSIKGGAVAQTISNTIVVGNVALAINEVRIFVRATPTNNEGRSAYNTVPFTVAAIGNVTPAAPTLIAQNDSNDTFRFAPPAGYTVGQCVYSLKGSAPAFCVSDTLNVGDIDVAIGELQVYVSAAEGRNRGDVLRNEQAFTKTFTPSTLAVTLTVSASTVTVGGSISFAAAASGGTAPYTYLTQATNTNNGIPQTIGNLATGSWTAQAAGSFELTTTVTDEAGTTRISAIRPVTVTASVTTPDAPTVSFDVASRVLSASHPLLGTTDLEYSQGTGAWQAYAALSIDDNEHAAGTWKFRVKAAEGRNPSVPRESPYITAVVYDTVLTGPSDSAPDGTTLTTAGDAGKLAYNKRPLGSSDSKRMDLYIGSTQVAAVDFLAPIMGQKFTYTTTNGATYKGVFTDGNITLIAA